MICRMNYKTTVSIIKMLEFIVGWIIGVWAAQQLPLPSVQIAIKNWWNGITPELQEQPPDASEITAEDHESAPIFTGNMPSV